MESEYGIAGDFEKYDDEKEFRRLVRAVKFSKKHFLYFVCCNQVPKQNELIGEIKKSLKGKKIKLVKFKKSITDLLAELQTRKFPEDCEAVFVQGLEYSISSDHKGSENALIHNLNISRDSFKKYFSCPIFFWLPEYALIKITRHAPDFFSVRSGTFYFSSTAEQVTEQIFQSFTSGWVETSSMPVTEKLKRIETLERLLAEYRGLHEEKRNKQTEARLLRELGNFFDSISEYRKALNHYEQALSISSEIGYLDGEGKHLGDLGVIYCNLGEYRKAIEYYEQALLISREIGDRGDEERHLGNLGSAYIHLGEYREAIDYTEQALSISREIGDRAGEGRHLGNLGVAYGGLDEYRKELEYYEQALSISREIGDRNTEGISLGNLGVAYINLSEYRRAIDYYEKALTLFREIGDRRGEGRFLGNLGSVYFRLGEREKACGLWKEAVVILEVVESPSANPYRQNLERFCKD